MRGGAEVRKVRCGKAVKGQNQEAHIQWNISSAKKRENKFRDKRSVMGGSDRMGWTGPVSKKALDGGLKGL